MESPLLLEVKNNLPHHNPFSGLLGDMSSGEEERHPWHPNRSTNLDVPWPLLRVWDYYSGSQPDESGCMRSRAPRQRLDSVESRKTSLETHLNHKVWVPTPYISFTKSHTALEELAKLRDLKRKGGPQTLIAIDPGIRLRKGLPVLHVAPEMEHYGIPDPYGRSNKYYIDHYVCLWEVTAEEVVGQWLWKDLATNERWYKDIVMPAYQRKRERAPDPSEDEVSGMASLIDHLCRRVLTQGEIARLTVQVDGDLSDATNFDAVSSSPSEELAYGFNAYGDNWDSEDEAEEANASDDLINILEGNW